MANFKHTNTTFKKLQMRYFNLGGEGWKKLLPVNVYIHFNYRLSIKKNRHWPQATSKTTQIFMYY